MPKNRILAVCGQTAVGKTKYAIGLANAFDGEIISCDAMQIYQSMDIGSAKPTAQEQQQAVHHLVDFQDPREPFSVAKYKVLAEAAIDDCLSRGKLPILAGGTGLYLNAILYDMDFAAPPAQDPKVRQKLYQLAEQEGPQALHQRLMALDPAAAARIHPNNVKKVIRALEAAQLGQPVADFGQRLAPNPKYDPLLLTLVRDREELYDRINQRVDQLMDAGLLEEVQGLAQQGLTEEHIAMKGIGYKELFAYLHGESTLEESVEKIKQNTRHYAKRQGTWFRRYEERKEFNLSQYPDDASCLEAIITWLKKQSLYTTKPTNQTTL